MQKVLVNEIEYIESWKDYVRVYLESKRNFLVKQSISSIQNILSDYKFIRVHRSYIVSMQKITSYRNTKVILGEKHIPIGRFYKKNVFENIRSL